MKEIKEFVINKIKGGEFDIIDILEIKGHYVTVKMIAKVDVYITHHMTSSLRWVNAGTEIIDKIPIVGIEADVRDLKLKSILS